MFGGLVEPREGIGCGLDRDEDEAANQGGIIALNQCGIVTNAVKRRHVALHLFCMPGRKVMEWFSRKTSIAGIQIPNWGIVLGAVIVILLIYTSMH